MTTNSESLESVLVHGVRHDTLICVATLILS